MWNLILESNLINFIVVFVIMAYIIKKINVGDKIENVRKTIKSYVDESSNEKAAAEKELSQIQAKIEHLQDDIKDIEATAQNNIKGFENKIQEEIYEKNEFEDYVLYEFKHEKPYKIERVGESKWRVTGPELEKLLKMTRFNSDESALRFASKLKALGVDEELKTLVAKEGDTVQILNQEFEYEERLY